MIIRIFGLDNDLIIDEEKISLINVYSNKLYSKLIEDLNNKIKGENEEDSIIILNDQGEEINYSKEMVMIIDYYNFDINSKKILGILYEYLSNYIKTEQSYIIEKSINDLKAYIEVQVSDLPIEFSMKDDIKYSDLFKMFDIKVDFSNRKSILERIEGFIDILKIMKICNVLILVNIKHFLTNEELIELYKYSLYNSIKLVLLEQGEESKLLPYEQVLQIDESFCDSIKLN